jgi:hypothetical protein
MKIKGLLLVGFLMSQIVVTAQSEAPEDILAGMAQKISDALGKDPTVKEVTVATFTKDGGQTTVVGDYLTELFIDGLINAGNRSYDFLPLESLQTKNPSAFADIMNTTLRILTYDPNRPQEAPSQKNAPVNSAENTKTKFKKLDVIITGSITEFSEHFEVVVQALNHRKDDQMISRDRKNIPKTFHIRELLEKEKVSDQSGGKELPAVATFPKDDLVFDLLGCKQNGRMIDCNLKVTNNGRSDLELHIYGGDNTRIFSAANGVEYNPIALKLAENADDGEVVKSIVAGSSVGASVTFGNVTEVLSKISKIEIRSHASGSGYFNAEFRNIAVKR